MRVRGARAWSAALVAGAMVALPAAAEAQPSAPWTSSHDDGPARTDAVCAQAVMLLRLQRAAAARALLERHAAGHAVDPDGVDVLAVLLRLARAAEDPSRIARPAPSTGAEDLPAPPTEADARRRVLDGLVERIARGDLRGAAAFDAAVVDPSFEGSAEAPARAALRRVYDMPAAQLGYAPSPPPGVLLPDRPPGTIEGFEVVDLYATATGLGFVLGTWGGLAATDDGHNVARLVLPITGVAVGLGAAFALDRARVIRRGRAYAATAGFVLGTLAGGGAALYAGPSEVRDTWGILSLGAVLGLGAGIGVAHFTDALPGAASLTASAGVWGGFVGMAISEAAGPSGSFDDAQRVAAGLLMGEGVGVALALLSAHALRPTPAQTRWADVGAISGALLGGALGATSEDARIVSGLVAAGVLGGGVIGYVLGAHSDAERAAYLERSAAVPAPLRVSFTPVAHGGVLSVGL